MKRGTSFESRTTDRAIFNQAEVCLVDAELIEKLKAEALRSPLGRYRLCMHHSTEEPGQDMIVVHCRGNYSRPHCHPEAAMSFTMIEGRLDILLFDDEGNVIRRVRLGCSVDADVDAVSLRLSGGVMYMPACMTETAVFQEVLASPNPNGAANRYPEWSPEDVDSEGIAAFLRRVGVSNQ